MIRTVSPGRSRDSLEDQALDALATGCERQVIGTLLTAAARTHDARLWQWAGLLHRSLDEHDAAIAALTEAARLAPADAGIAHGLARTTFEAGLDARAAYASARTLSPESSDVLIGEAAARTAMGEGTAVADQLGALLRNNPGWLAGHQQFAQLQAFLGASGRASSSLDEAIERDPRNPALWDARFDLAVRTEDYVGLAELVNGARRAGLVAVADSIYAAIAAAETGDDERASALLARLPSDLTAVWHLRFLLRTGRIDRALVLVEELLAGPGRSDVWPYALLVWRLVDDPRAAWLTEGLVRTFDVVRNLPPLDGVADQLRQLHQRSGAFLDQSVRGGTQTDGPLFSRIDPTIRLIRGAMVTAVERYRDALPPRDPRHPLLGPPRDREVRFSGSWSVRLEAGGRHAHHIHPQGWISSALYIALPSSAPPPEGWLTLGEPPPTLGLNLPAMHHIEPVPGRLVLFPSWLWHGTAPFTRGERLTVAFDVAPS